MATEQKDLTSEEALRLLTFAVWNANEDNDGDCPPEKIPTFRQIDDLISTTAWGAEARNEFFRRWVMVEKISDKSFDGVSSFAQLAHLVWQEAVKSVSELKHPLAPLIDAWHSRPLEVMPVRDTNGNLRGDTIAPRIAMRESGAKTDRLYLPPAHIELDGQGGQIAMPGFGEGNTRTRIPVLPIELYDLGVKAGVSRGGHGGAPIPARMLVKLAAAPSTSVRHGERFVTYNITLRDLRDAISSHISGRQVAPDSSSKLPLASRPRSNQDNQPGSPHPDSQPRHRLRILPSLATHKRELRAHRFEHADKRRSRYSAGGRGRRPVASSP